MNSRRGAVAAQIGPAVPASHAPASDAEVVVIGGGVAGLACALYLARGGAQVVVLEANRLGSGASSGNGGWIAPTLAGPLPEPGLTRAGLSAFLDRDSALYFAPRSLPGLMPWLARFRRACTPEAFEAGCHALSRLCGGAFEMMDELIGDGLSVELHRTGCLAVSANPDGVEHFLARLAPMRNIGVDVPDHAIGEAAVRELEPGLTGPLPAGVWMPNHWHVRPESMLEGLAALAQEAGVTILEGAEVTEIERQGDRATMVYHTVGRVRPQQLVLAAGAWSPVLGAMLGVKLPIAPGKGYSFDVEPSIPIEHSLMLLDPHVVCSPLGDGRVRVAGTMEFSGRDRRIDRRRVESIVRGARAQMAPWRGEPSSPWVGMRPIAPDGLPIIDRAPGVANAFVATGYSMVGMTIALPAAQALADFMLSAERPEVLAPFGSGRFSTMRRSAVAA